MSKRRHIDLVCGIGAAVMVLVTLLVLGGGGALLQAAAADMPYTGKLFSTEKVHEIDIVANGDDWEEMLQNAMSEEYISCTLVVDGESFKNVAIRPKGNSSLSTVANSESDRYSFKIEFDHYDKNSSYYGLDKLCLNNAIQDNTYMKDYLCYRMMDFLGADAPLSSFAWITVNGEDWGLYTAVEAVEDAFAQREYGADHGQIYKPDSTDMGGGGRGFEARRDQQGEDLPQGGAPQEGDLPQGGAPQEGNLPQGGAPQEGNLPQGGAPQGEDALQGGGLRGGKGGFGSSSDVLLQYSDDDPESYPNIFDNAVFDSVTDADQERLIQSLKALGQGDVEGSLDVDEVIRYFAVHNFVLNEDSYTGTIIHNYYLYEKDGLLSMIPWDYNLAFGGMGGMGAGDDASAVVNSPIDSPVSSGEISQRPMVSWIFDSEEYTERYHQVMDQFLSEFFESGYFETVIDETVASISPYVEKDPTAFCTYEEFQKGAETLKEFCLLRAQSVRGQLDGTIPSTSEGQAEDDSSFVDASHIALSDMGSQGGRNGGLDRLGGKGEETGQESSSQTGPDGEGGEPSEDRTEENQAGETQEIPRQNGGREFPGGADFSRSPGTEEQEQPGSLETWLLLGGSAAILAAGLLFAKFYR